MNSSQPNGVDYFFNSHPLAQIQAKVSLNARRELFLWWLERARPEEGDSVLDVGSTPDVKRIDSNCFIKWLLQNKFKVSTFSIETVDHLKSEFPELIHVYSSAPALNCVEDRFDWSISSAVLEHVGNASSQRAFLMDLARISKKGFMITTPNRWHWLEFHTKIPLLHWLPKRIHRFLLRCLGLKFWAREGNLNLVGMRDLKNLTENISGFDFEITGRRFLGPYGNLIVIARRQSTDVCISR